jgi:hypothetical protein
MMGSRESSMDNFQFHDEEEIDLEMADPDAQYNLESQQRQRQEPAQSIHYHPGIK